MRAENPNMEAEERKAKKKVEKINEKRLALTKEYQQLVQQCISTGKSSYFLFMAISFTQSFHSFPKADPTQIYYYFFCGIYLELKV